MQSNLRSGLRGGIATLIIAAAGACLPQHASATNFSFTGNFSADDDVQLFNFTADGSSTVRLISFGYGGGTQANGNVVARGGFDPILALFNGSGLLIGQDDDAISTTTGACGSGVVTPDASTGQEWDTCLDLTLAAGNYTVSIQEYDNFANGPTLTDGFGRTGQDNFTDTGGPFACGDDPNNTAPFHDVSGTSPGCLRDQHWAFDILNVSQAEIVATPEPASAMLLGAGLAIFGAARWKQRRRRHLVSA